LLRSIFLSPAANAKTPKRYFRPDAVLCGGFLGFFLVIAQCVADMDTLRYRTSGLPRLCRAREFGYIDWHWATVKD